MNVDKQIRNKKEFDATGFKVVTSRNDGRALSRVVLLLFVFFVFGHYWGAGNRSGGEATAFAAGTGYEQGRVFSTASCEECEKSIRYFLEALYGKGSVLVAVHPKTVALAGAKERTGYAATVIIDIGVLSSFPMSTELLEHERGHLVKVLSNVCGMHPEQGDQIDVQFLSLFSKTKNKQDEWNGKELVLAGGIGLLSLGMLFLVYLSVRGCRKNGLDKEAEHCGSETGLSEQVRGGDNARQKNDISAESIVKNVARDMPDQSEQSAMFLRVFRGERPQVKAGLFDLLPLSEKGKVLNCLGHEEGAELLHRLLTMGSTTNGMTVPVLETVVRDALGGLMEVPGDERTSMGRLLEVRILLQNMGSERREEILNFLGQRNETLLAWVSDKDQGSGSSVKGRRAGI